MRKTSLKTKSSQDDEIVVEVTQEQYRAALARGLAPDETLAPGVHKFIRGGFRKRHPNFDPAKVEVRYNVTLSLPPAVYDYFKQQAELNNAASCAEAIEKVLIEVMERAMKANIAPAPAQREALLDDPQFIRAVADRVKKSLSKKSSPSDKRRRRAA